MNETGANERGETRPKVCRVCSWDPTYADEEGYRAQDHYCPDEERDE